MDLQNRLDISQLRTQQNRGQFVSQEQALKAAQSYNKGLQALQTYERSGHKLHLRTALFHFIDSMALQRQRIEPLLALAGIYHSLANAPLAHKYFQLAEALDASAPSVIRMRGQLFQPPSAEGGPVSVQFPNRSAPPTPGPDCEQFYQQSERVIARLETYLHQLQLPAAPHFHPEVSQPVAEVFAKLQTVQQALERDLEVAQQEMDTTPLRQRVQGLAGFLYQIQLWLNHCQALAELHRQMADLNKRMRMALRLSRPPEKLLETFLDNCDQLSARFNDLASQGLDTTALMEDYQNLLLVMATFQDQLDNH